MKASGIQLALRTSVVLCGLIVGLSSPLSANLVISQGGVACAIPNSGLCSPNLNATTITFDGLAGQLLPYSTGPVTYSWAGGGAGSPFVNGNVGGQYANPPGDSTDYLTVGSPGRPNQIDITFSTPMRYFGLFMGSPDTYNFITFDFYSPDGVQTISGSDLFAVANGDQTKGQYFTFTTNPASQGFDRITLRSDGVAFETDNHSYQAVPDGGMTLMLLGGALVGLESLRRRFRG